MPNITQHLKEGLAEASLLGVDSVCIPVWVAEALVKQPEGVVEALVETMLQAQSRGSNTEEPTFGWLAAVKTIRRATGMGLKETRNALKTELAKHNHPSIRSQLHDPNQRNFRP